MAKEGISYQSLLFSVGSWGFLIASPLFFPALYSLHGAAIVAGWSYTVSSLCFLIADLTDEHINVASILGSASYTAGSALFIPAFYRLFWGSLLFVVGSALIVVARAPKLALVDLLIAVGGACYLVGSICGVGATGFCDLNILASLYTAGALSFWCASMISLYRPAVPASSK